MEYAKEILFAHARDYIEHGRKVVPINGKKPTLEAWTSLRSTEISLEQVRAWLSNPLVERIGILLDHSILALDYDGAGSYVIWNKLVPRCSAELQNAFHGTTLTITPHGGHILFSMDFTGPQDRIKEIQCWWNGKEHNQVLLLSQNKYLVERGIGYEAKKGIDSLEKLTPSQVSELISLFRRVRLETIAIKSAVHVLQSYYYNTNRNNLTFGISGFLHREGLEEYLIKDMQEYLMDIVDVDTQEERQQRFRVIEQTCTKDRNTGEVSGKDRLLEAVNNDNDVLESISKAFRTLGYFKSSVAGNGNTSNISNTEGEENRKQKIAAKLYEVVLNNVEEIFKDQLNNAFAAIKIDGHIETIPIANNGKFKMWVCKTYYEMQNELMTNTDALTAVCNMLQAKAYFGKKMVSLDLRSSSNGLLKDTLTIYYDLTNGDWEQVEITPLRWSIKKSTEAPTIFRRYSNHLPQIYPSRDYTSDIFEQFMELINATVRDKDGTVLIEETKQLRLLLKCYIISLFIPEIPKAALMLHGDEGGAKTALQEFIKALVDPSAMLTLTFPQDPKELIQQISHNFLAFYDNVNRRLPDWVSDLLCRVITGSGFSKRMLYTDDDDVIYNFCHCIGINGINLAATKADLLDRSLIIRLSRLMKKHRRKLKDDIWPAFQRMKPQLLGYIFDILVKVLQVRRDGGIVLDARSRMADWEEYSEIIARCMRYDDFDFINAYEENKSIKTETLLADSSVAQAILRLVESNDFRGTATQLLQKLETIAQELGTNTKEKTWPKSASALSRKLNSLSTVLMEAGIQVTSVTEDTKSKLKSIVVRKMPSEASEPSDTSKSCSNQDEMSGCIAETKDERPPEMPSDETSENHAQNPVSDASDASDDIYPNIKENETEQLSSSSHYSQDSCTTASIYRIGNTDFFGCSDCKLKSDKWFMQKHNCRGQSYIQKTKVTEAMPSKGLLEYNLTEDSESENNLANL